MTTPIAITLIVALAIVAIVALCLYHARKVRCPHHWKIIDSNIKHYYRKSRYSYGNESNYNYVVYTLQCQHCGEIKIVSDEELTSKIRKELAN